MPRAPPNGCTWTGWRSSACAGWSRRRNEEVVMAVGDRLRGQDLLLGETSSLCAFAQVGHAHTLVDWFGDTLWVVREVHDELLRNRARFAATERLVRHLEDRRRIVHLSAEGVTWVARMAAYFRTPCDHGRKNVGELATARLAREMVRGGR